MVVVMVVAPAAATGSTCVGLFPNTRPSSSLEHAVATLGLREDGCARVDVLGVRLFIQVCFAISELIMP